jgi:hypothetical protein
LNLRRVSDVRQVEIHTAEPYYEVEIATAELKNYKSSGSDQIPTELIQAGDETLPSGSTKCLEILEELRNWRFLRKIHSETH